MNKIELIKEQEVTGETWWYVKLNGITQKSFREEQEAKNFFHDCKERMKQGYPKKEVIDEENF